MRRILEPQSKRDPDIIQGVRPYLQVLHPVLTFGLNCLGFFLQSFFMSGPALTARFAYDEAARSRAEPRTLGREHVCLKR
jgi:hypothetical protein